MSIGMMIYLSSCKGNGNVQAGGDVWKDKQ